MKLHVLVLCTNKNQHYLFEALKKQGHTWECFTPEELNLLISDSVNGNDRMYADDGEDNPKRLHLKSFNGIVVRLSGTGEYGLTILQHLNVNLGIYSTATAHAIRIASNKVQTSQAISSAGLRSPVTVFGRNFKNPKFFVDKLWDNGIVVKTPYGSEGKTVAPFFHKEDAIAGIQILNGCGNDIMIQQMIPGGGVDYRAIVVNGEVVLVMRRTAKEGNFHANISKGGKGDKVEFSDDLKDFCVRAAKAIGLDFAGVDIMLSKKDGKAYLIEINSNSGPKACGICNYNYFDDVVKMLEKNAVGKTTDETKSTSNFYNPQNPESEFANTSLDDLPHIIKAKNHLKEILGC
jgi:ribosomal protein S6--L-glutamate ligase